MSDRIDVRYYRQAEHYFFSAIALKTLDLADGVHAYATGEAGINLIYIQENTGSLGSMLLQAKQFYDQDASSFEVIIPEQSCTAAVEAMFDAMGAVQTGRSVAMMLDLERWTVDRTVDLDDETVIQGNDDRLNEWMLPLISAFASTRENCSVYAAAHEAALRKNTNLRHISLYKNNVPIASSSLSMHDSIARIDDVATCMAYQGRGYATALMRYTISEAKQGGARYCFLESSDLGLGLYLRLGFKPLFTNILYRMERA